MADSDIPLARIGGRVNTETGQLLSTDDVDRIGGMALQNLCNFLSLMFFDSELGVPASGFPRDTITRAHCRVSASTDLGFSVSTGFGLSYNSAATTDEFGVDVYRPIVVSSTITDSLDAHDGSNPRIDLVCLAPAWTDDQSASRNVKNPGTGVVSSSSVNQRRRFGATYQIVTGTPAATPSIPAVPTGYIAVGMARVPAGSGAAVWTDVRAPLTFGSFFKALPKYATADYVPLGANNELEVDASSPAAMSVEVNSGRAVINGVMRAYADETLTITAADPSLPRVDLVVARENGTLSVIAGTPSISPYANAGALPSNAVPIAEVLITAAATTIASADIRDVRLRGPVGNSQVQERSLDAQRMQVPQPKITAGTVTGVSTEIAVIPLSITWPDGSDLPDRVIDENQLIFKATVTRALVTGGTTSGNDYGSVPAQSVTQYTYDDSTLPSQVNYLKAGTNISEYAGFGDDLSWPILFFTMDDQTDPTCTLQLRRESTPGSYSCIVEIECVSHPGLNAVVKVTFT